MNCTEVFVGALVALTALANAVVAIRAMVAHRTPAEAATLGDEQREAWQAQCTRDVATTAARLDNLIAVVRQLNADLCRVQLSLEIHRRRQMATTPTPTTPAKKPAYLTTEFWMTAITTGVTLLVVLGYVPRTSSDEFTQMIVTVVTNVLALISSGGVVTTYILARVKAKSEEAQPAAPPQPAPVPAPSPPESGDLTDNDMRV